MGQSLPFQISASQTTTIGSPSFAAQTVRMDNPASYWVHFPLSGWVPPFQFGVVIPLALSQRGATIAVNTVDVPSGFLADTSNTTATATGVLYEDALPPNTGISLRVTGAAGVVIQPANNTYRLVNISVPTTGILLGGLANRLAIRVTNPPSATQAVFVGPIGVTSGTPTSGGSQGITLAAGQSETWGIGFALSLVGIVASGTQVVQVEEVA